MKGKVKWFDRNKGYGFILDSENNKEYFVHWKAIVTKTVTELKVLEQGEPVEFDTMDTDRGEQAVNVVRLDPEVVKEN